MSVDFRQLVGKWRVDSFVNVAAPSCKTYIRKNSVPSDLEGLIHRGEIVSLVSTAEDPMVLYGIYGQPAQKKGRNVGDFFVVRSKTTGGIHI